jgi:type VI protein secretion system component VasK
VAPSVLLGMDSSEEDDVLGLMGLALVLKGKERRKRKWTKDWLLKREKYTHTNVLNELKFQTDDFKNYLRMDEDTYQNLLTMVTPLIEKKDTNMRKSISAHERLSATLRYLATGRSFQDLKFSTFISPQSLGKTVPKKIFFFIEG